MCVAGKVCSVHHFLTGGHSPSYHYKQCEHIVGMNDGR